MLDLDVADKVPRMSIVLFANELYGLPILRPLAAAAGSRGIEAAWVVTDAIAQRMRADEKRLTTLAHVRQWNARSVFCAANWVSPEFPGNKVQVFHGFSSDKRSRERGHFRLRGFFDLYCTQGPDTTLPFKSLAARHRYFAVAETGWSKLDPLFGPGSELSASLQKAAAGRPCVMYASTFTEDLSAAPNMLQSLSELVARGDRYWLLTLHPKCRPALFDAYRSLAEQHPENATFLETEQLLDMMRAADVLVCDTSSVIDEFAVQLKPVVTVRNRIPKPYMLNVLLPDEVDAAVTRALAHPNDLIARIEQHANNIHPYRDGQSSERMLDAAEHLANSGFGPLARRPLNLWRRCQARGRLPALLPG